MWPGPGSAAASGPTAAPAVPGETQTTVPAATAAAHHQQGSSMRVCLCVGTIHTYMCVHVSIKTMFEQLW